MMSSAAGSEPVRIVLAATDFSPGPEVALRWATAIAAHHGAVLELVHAVQPMPVMDDHMGLPREVLDAFSQTAQERLGELVAKLAKEGVEATAHAEVGTAFRVITERAEARHADLVVMGTRGFGVLRRLLIGTTARRVLRHAHVPVLSVPPESGIPQIPPEVVLAPTDFTAHARRAADEAVRVFGLAGAASRMVLYHAWSVPGDLQVYGEKSAQRLRRSREQVSGRVAERLEREVVRLKERGVHAEPLFREARPIPGVIDEAATQRARVIAAGTTGLSSLERFLLGSVVERLVELAPCPVLTAHERIAGRSAARA